MKASALTMATAALLGTIAVQQAWAQSCFAHTRAWDTNCPAPDYESVSACKGRTNCSEHIDHTWQARSFAGSWGNTLGTSLYTNRHATVQGLVQYTERAVQARATPNPNVLVLAQADAPDIVLKYVNGAYADLPERQCMTRKLTSAVAAVPLIVMRSLPHNVTVNIDGSLGQGEAFARKTANGYEVDLEPFWIPHCRHDDWRDRQTTSLEEILVHEFAHLLDWRFGVTRHLGGGEHHGEFWTRVHTEGRPNDTAFATCYMATDEGEHFAESLGVWLAYRAGRLGGGGSPARIQEDMYIQSKMCRELEWWDRQAIKAAANVHGGFELAPRPATLADIFTPPSDDADEASVFDVFRR